MALFTHALEPYQHALRELAVRLIKAPSITPEDAGAQSILINRLEQIGFVVTKLPYGVNEQKTENFFARLGTGAPHICFAGHTDVVPPGQEHWQYDPFAGEIDQGILYGRGACDMKGGIAAYVVAIEAYLAQFPLKGSLSFLITGDEEGTGAFGTKKVLEWMKAHNQIPDFCLVGEPTNPSILGQAIKIGRRGSLNAHLIVKGVQGHVAYPQRADNPVHRMVKILDQLVSEPLDQGTEWFEPSSLQVTSVDCGNVVTNIIPGQCEARLNIRFNISHTGKKLEEWLNSIVSRFAAAYELKVDISGEAFLTEPGREVESLRQAIKACTGLEAELNTGGGTSDARFITMYCPVAEFGLVGQSMHKVDEHVALPDLYNLAEIYFSFLERVYT